MATFAPPQAPEMQERTQSYTAYIDLEAQPITQSEATHTQDARRPSQTGSEAASQTNSSNSSKSLSRWEEYKPGNFKPRCSHNLDPSKCTECGSKKSQKKLFWAGSLLCAAGLIAMFVVIAILESDQSGDGGKPEWVDGHSMVLKWRPKALFGFADLLQLSGAIRATEI
jgi:hypothetical protein